MLSDPLYVIRSTVCYQIVCVLSDRICVIRSYVCYQIVCMLAIFDYYSEQMNLAVLMLMEDGTLPRLKIRWWKGTGICGTDGKVN